MVLTLVQYQNDKNHQHILYIIYIERKWKAHILRKWERSKCNYRAILYIKAVFLLQLNCIDHIKFKGFQMLYLSWSSCSNAVIIRQDMYQIHCTYMDSFFFRFLQIYPSVVVDNTLSVSLRSYQNASDGKTHVSVMGNSGVSIVWGIHHFLKYKCGAHMSWDTTRIRKHKIYTITYDCDKI